MESESGSAEEPEQAGQPEWPAGPGPGGQPGELVQPGPAGRRWWPLAVLVAVTLLLGGVSLALNRMAAGSGDDAAAAGDQAVRRGYACAYMRVGSGADGSGNGADDGRDYCQRAALDHGRRQPLGAAQQEQALRASGPVAAVVRTAVRSCAGRDAEPSAEPGAPEPGGQAAPQLSECLPRRPPRAVPASPGGPVAEPAPEPLNAATAAQQIRRALLTRRYADVIVRIARADDPAPAGAVVYAVRIDGACVFGYWTLIGSAGAQVGGPLPGGGCLAS
ncbi:MAG TPA: hypothetical protein VMU51_32850 [Mycobacteriales bacterium]|nr:hypothetical protein [Mycobacteriales bacterium]